MRFTPQSLSNLLGVHFMGFPPFPLIASGMIFVVMDGAECDGEFVDLI